MGDCLTLTVGKVWYINTYRLVYFSAVPMTQYLMQPFDVMGGIGIWAHQSPPWGLECISRRQLAARIRAEYGIAKLTLPKSCSESVFAAQAIQGTLKHWRSEDNLVTRLPRHRWEPPKKKHVTFADDEGLDLVTVCVFDQTAPPMYLFTEYVEPLVEEYPPSGASSPKAVAIIGHESSTDMHQAEPPVATSSIVEEASSMAARRTNLIDVSLAFLFVLMPRRELNNVPVALTAVRFNDHARALEGSISVLNMAYHKDVCIRYSWDGWATCSEQPASYACSPADSNYDVFTFSLPIAENAQLGQRVAFAIRYKPHVDDCDEVEHGQESGEASAVCEGDEASFWDNNNGANFEAICTLPLPRVVRS